MIATVVAIVLGLFFIYQSAQNSINPLSVVNQRLTEVLTAPVLEELTIRQEQRTSYEIDNLINLFQTLIQTKRFTLNTFLTLSDALAVIDLAEASIMFKEK